MLAAPDSGSGHRGGAAGAGAIQTAAIVDPPPPLGGRARWWRRWRRRRTAACAAYSPCGAPRPRQAGASPSRALHAAGVAGPGPLRGAWGPARLTRARKRRAGAAGLEAGRGGRSRGDREAGDGLAARDARACCSTAQPHAGLRPCRHAARRARFVPDSDTSSNPPPPTQPPGSRLSSRLREAVRVGEPAAACAVSLGEPAAACLRAGSLAPVPLKWRHLRVTSSATRPARHGGPAVAADLSRPRAVLPPAAAARRPAGQARRRCGRLDRPPRSQTLVSLSFLVPRRNEHAAQLRALQGCMDQVRSPANLKPIGAHQTYQRVSAACITSADVVCVHHVCSPAAPLSHCISSLRLSSPQSGLPQHTLPGPVHH